MSFVPNDASDAHSVDLHAIIWMKGQRLFVLVGTFATNEDALVALETRIGPHVICPRATRPNGWRAYSVTAGSPPLVEL